VRFHGATVILPVSVTVALSVIVVMLIATLLGHYHFPFVFPALKKQRAHRRT
jgi:hypothetical protein